MAIPDDRLATSPQPEGTFIWGKNTIGISVISDYEYGGIALSDPSQGHLTNLWNTKISDDGNLITTQTEGVSASILYSGTDITEVSCSFDQNMRPAFAFVEAGQAKFEWYDTSVQDRVLTILANDVTCPRVLLDDKRLKQVGASDVLLFYMRGTNLYMARQRDRYEIEYLLGIAPTDHEYLGIVGMNNLGRLQFEFRSEPTEVIRELTLEEALATAPSSVQATGEESQPSVPTTFDIGESNTWNPDNS